MVADHDVGQPIDPAWIANKYPNLTPMRFTVLKKVLRCGTGGKSYIQDLEDCIGALQRELGLITADENEGVAEAERMGEKLAAKRITVENLMQAEQQQAQQVIQLVKKLIEDNNEKMGLKPVS